MKWLIVLAMGLTLAYGANVKDYMNKMKTTDPADIPCMPPCVLPSHRRPGETAGGLIFGTILQTITKWDIGAFGRAKVTTSSTGKGCGGGYKIFGGNGWCSAADKVGNWVEFSFTHPVTWTAIATQPRAAPHRMFVKKYKVVYTTNGRDWIPYKNQKQFAANVGGDRDKVRYHLINIYALAIRIKPLAWHSHMSMRFNAYYQPSKTLYAN